MADSTYRPSRKLRIYPSGIRTRSQVKAKREEEITRFPTDTMRIISSYSDPGIAKLISFLNSEVTFPESLKSIRERFSEFIDAVNNGDYNTIFDLLEIGFDIKFAEYLQNFFIISSKNIRVIDLFSERGMKLTVNNLHSILNLDYTYLSRHIIARISIEDLEYYLDELIKNFGINIYLVNLTISLGMIFDLRFHIYFTEKLLDLADIAKRSSVSSTKPLLILTVLKIEADTLLSQENDTREALDLIYDAIATFGLVILQDVPNIRVDLLANLILELSSYASQYKVKILSGISRKLRQRGFD